MNPAPGPANGAAPANGAPPAGDPAAEPQVPEGFEAPKSPPPEFSIEKELITADEVTALQKELGARYRTQFRNADMSLQSVVPSWAKLRLYSMTLKDNRTKLHELRTILTDELRQAGNLVKGDQQVVRRFREMLFKEVQARATELLDNQFHVRLQAVLILGSLTLVEPDEKNNIREEAYTPPWEPLLQVVGDPNQHQALKIAACNGLRRILLLGTLRSDQSKTQIARTLTAELMDPGAHPWYQIRLCDTLGAVNLELTLDNERAPLVIDTLSKVAADDQRDLCVRAEAAKALGRAPLPAGTSDQVLAWVIADVAYDLTAAYNQDAAAAQRQQAAGALGSRLAQSQLCLFRVYSAFQPDAEDRRLYEGRKPGLVAKRTGDKSILDTFGLTVPVVAHVLKQPEGRVPQQVWNPVPDAQIKALGDWLAGNVPATARVHQQLAPLSLNVPGGGAAVDNAVPPGTQPTSTTANR
jgi:hypothetical protein